MLLPLNTVHIVADCLDDMYNNGRPLCIPAATIRELRANLNATNDQLVQVALNRVETTMTSYESGPLEMQFGNDMDENNGLATLMHIVWFYTQRSP